MNSTGKELDMIHGWHTYNYGARTYDPTLGRWMSQDPMQDRFPWVSPYSYCINDPVNAIDPDGRKIEWVDSEHSDEVYGRVQELRQNSEVDCPICCTLQYL